MDASLLFIYMYIYLIAYFDRIYTDIINIIAAFNAPFSLTVLDFPPEGSSITNVLTGTVKTQSPMKILKIRVFR